LPGRCFASSASTRFHVPGTRRSSLSDNRLAWVADLFVVPAPCGPQREAAAEGVLAQAPLDHEQAVAGEQGGVVAVGFGEEGNLQPAAAVLDLHEHLTVALLAQADDLAGDHGFQLRAPAAARGLGAVLPDLLEVAQVVAGQAVQFVT